MGGELDVSMGMGEILQYGWRGDEMVLVYRNGANNSVWGSPFCPLRLLS